MRRRIRWVVLGALAIATLVIVPGRVLPSYLVSATDLAVLPLVTPVPELDVPPTPQGRAIVAHLGSIDGSTRSSRYAHRTDVDTAAGRYHWDCSGMVGWLLRRHAPRAFAAVGRGRPVASDYTARIAAAPRRPGGPWQHIERIEDVRAGDVFAWRSIPALRGDGNTGHTGIVISRPQRVVASSEVWAVRIADSTTVPHERDSRTATGDVDGGLGIGTMTFAVGPDGAVTHYGWAGVLSPIYVETRVVFGRVGG